MERKGFKVNIDGRQIFLNEDNHGLAFFRDEPDNNYLDITEEIGPDEEETKHTLVFRNHALFLWMGNIALTPEDQGTLAEANLQLEPFRERHGWNSKVLIEDRPTEFERELHTQFLLQDLTKAEGLPGDWETEDDTSN